MKIYGAGMAGLLAANVLRRMQPEVLEAQPCLPNNHSALLRFRSDVVAKATGVPFKRVEVHKAIAYEGRLLSQTNLALNNMYSQKVTGRITPRSIVNLHGGERFIAPSDFINQIAASTDVRYNSPLVGVTDRDSSSEPVISTIPMPVMMALVGWDDVPVFEFKQIWSVRCKLQGCDIYQTIYYPDYRDLAYRASITGDQLIVECLSPPDATQAGEVLDRVLNDFGIYQTFPEFEVKGQKYGKLTPIDPDVCRRFILYLTDKYRIYSLGRFATWRQLLLDDVVKDLTTIERLIEYRDGYSARLEGIK